MKARHFLFATALTLSLGTQVPVAFAEENSGSVTESLKEAGQDTKKGVKKAYRNAKGELCEWFKGKLRCIDKKVEAKAKNAGDEVGDKAEDAGIIN